jgi:hypothetical protein
VTGRDDRGVVTAFVAIVAAGLLVVTGLVVDGGRAIATYREAADLAAAAARAGAQGVDDAALRVGVTRLDPHDARARARAFLDDAGHPGAGSVMVEGDRVTVAVTLTHEPYLLPTGSRRLRAEASASPVRGVEHPSIGGPPWAEPAPARPSAP